MMLGCVHFNGTESEWMSLSEFESVPAENK